MLSTTRNSNKSSLTWVEIQNRRQNGLCFCSDDKYEEGYRYKAKLILEKVMETKNIKVAEEGYRCKTKGFESR
jgi:hypothetical protein